MTTTVYVYTFRRGRGAWSRYRFPFDVEAFAQLQNDLYVKSAAGGVYKVSATGGANDTLPTSTPIASAVQWPWLDLGSPGITKMMHGVDVVASLTSAPAVSIDYDQRTAGAFVTTPYTLTSHDTLPGTVTPIPVSAPSFSVRLTFSEGGWSLQMVNLIVQDFGNGM